MWNKLNRTHQTNNWDSRYEFLWSFRGSGGKYHTGLHVIPYFIPSWVHTHTLRFLMRFEIPSGKRVQDYRLSIASDTKNFPKYRNRSAVTGSHGAVEFDSSSSAFCPQGGERAPKKEPGSFNVPFSFSLTKIRNLTERRTYERSFVSWITFAKAPNSILSPQFELIVKNEVFENLINSLNTSLNVLFDFVLFLQRLQTRFLFIFTNINTLSFQVSTWVLKMENLLPVYIINSIFFLNTSTKWLHGQRTNLRSWWALFHPQSTYRIPYWKRCWPIIILMSSLASSSHRSRHIGPQTS